jgi:hypothetical protein
VGVAVGGALVRRGQRAALGDDGGEHVGVARARMVGPAVADEVDGAVLGDHAVAQGPRQVGSAVVAQGDGGVGAGGDGVVDHHAVDRPPGALVVAVVGPPAVVLHDGDALVPQGGDEGVGGQGVRH